MKYSASFLLSFLFLGLSLPSASAHDVAGEMASAAKDFLATLTAEQKEKATYDLTVDERENWHFIPRPFEGKGMRGGLPLVEMRIDQQQLAQALLSTALSHRGYVTALQVMSLERHLWEVENEDPKRKSEMYYVSIFGEPGAKAWGWRYEGHHLSMNFTIKDGKLVSGTPSFYASNPAEILEGPRKGLRVLAGEEDVARKLVNSLDEEQQKTTIFSEKAPRDILTAAERKVSAFEEKGIAYGALNEAQQKNLNELIDVYIHRLRPEAAKDQLAKIKEAGWDKIRFAWAGGKAKGEPHYYYVQGPTFLLEYANTQNNANHVHAVWRDFDGDFGRDLLADHYAKSH